LGEGRKEWNQIKRCESERDSLGFFEAGFEDVR